MSWILKVWVNRNIVCLLAVFVVHSSCVAPTYYTIGYQVPRNPVFSRPTRFPGSLTVLKFTDKAKAVQSTTEKTYNDHARYAHRDLGEGISTMVARHLESAGLFEKVLYQSNMELASKTDTILTGDVERFEGWIDQPFDQMASLVIIILGGIIGGLIYLAVVKGQSKYYEGRTLLSNLKLIHARDGAVLWEGFVEGRVSGSGKLTPFSIADESLREATEELIRKLDGLTFKTVPSVEEASHV